tara:strand:+ start:953 stop:1147 length:195 start_codon:yes stop_codon:yes gene_type:complete
MTIYLFIGLSLSDLVIVSFIIDIKSMNEILKRINLGTVSGGLKNSSLARKYARIISKSNLIIVA